MYKCVYAIPVFICAALLSSGAVFAQTELFETQALEFGEWVITDNSTSHSITVETDGSYTHSPDLIMLDPPQQGIYQITGLPNNAIINSVTVIMTQPLEGGGSESFTMDDFDAIAPNADVNGETVVTLGATAYTSGNNNAYGDGDYSGELSLQINL